MLSLNGAVAPGGKARCESATRECEHCGTPFAAGNAEDRFCCAGCRFVFELIHEGGLERFYELKGEKTTSPVKSLVFQERDLGWLEEAAREAEGRLDLDVQGISCVGCVWLIESLFDKMPGTLRIDIDAHLGRMRLWWTPGEFDLAAFARELQRFGYLVGEAGKGGAPAGGSRELVLRLGLCGAFALNAMGFTLPRYLGMNPGFELARLFELVALLSATFSVFAGGSYFIRRAWGSLKLRVLHIDLPISLGIVLAYAGSIAGWLLGVERLMYFDFVAVFVFLMLLGRWVQEVAVERNRHRLLTGRAGAGRVARYAPGESAGDTVDAEEVSEGDDIGIAPGAVVPVSAELRSEAAELSLEWINGEAESKVWRRGARVPAGAVNLGAGEARVKAREGYADSVLATLLAEESDEAPGKDAGSRDMDRILRIYLAVVLAAGTAGGAAWLVLARDGAAALQVAISVFVVSCPCALGVALPLADEMAVRAMRWAGLFVRRGTLWRRLPGIRRVVFDKTGTLTTEVPRLVNEDALRRLAPAERAVLAEMVRESRHPFSRSLRETIVREWGGAAAEAGEELAVEEIVGSGVEAAGASGERWRLGRGGGEAGGDSVFSRDGRELASFRFEEALRPDAIEEAARLKRRGLELFVLSGDRVEKVRAVGATLALPEANCLGELRPEEKGEWMRRNGGSLYVGDGANDSLAFGESDCAGTPAADSAVLQRKADFFYLGRGLRAIGRLFEVAARRRLTVRGVFAFSLTYNCAAVTICLAGAMSPLLAAILMPISSLASLGIVVLGFRGFMR